VCPVNCEVSDWNNGDCDVSCGEGQLTRTRTITTNPIGNGAACPPLEETAACSTNVVCPVNCEVSNWTNGDCDVSCGEGQLTRTRTITINPIGNGAACPPLEETAACSTNVVCPVNCEVSDWTNGVCSVTCGEGQLIRTRTVTVEPAGNGAACPPLEETITCSPVDCLPALMHYNERCLSHCDGKYGPCEYCGSRGMCCKKKNAKLWPVGMHNECFKEVFGVKVLYPRHAADICLAMLDGAEIALTQNTGALCLRQCDREAGQCNFCGIHGACCRIKPNGRTFAHGTPDVCMLDEVIPQYTTKGEHICIKFPGSHIKFLASLNGISEEAVPSTTPSVAAVLGVMGRDVTVGDVVRESDSGVTRRLLSEDQTLQVTYKIEAEDDDAAIALAESIQAIPSLDQALAERMSDDLGVQVSVVSQLPEVVSDADAKTPSPTPHPTPSPTPIPTPMPTFIIPASGFDPSAVYNGFPKPSKRGKYVVTTQIHGGIRMSNLEAQQFCYEKCLADERFSAFHLYVLKKKAKKNCRCLGGDMKKVLAKTHLRKFWGWVRCGSDVVLGGVNQPACE